MDNELQTRMERLELRLMDLEHTLEILNRTTLELQQRNAQHAETIRHLETLLRQLSSSLPARSEPEPPPPHY
jgi:uncharacterized coiled-coil protein SlyX